MEVEKVHEELSRKALKTLETQQPVPEVDYYFCPFCGYTYEGPFQRNFPHLQDLG